MNHNKLLQNLERESAGVGGGLLPRCEVLGYFHSHLPIEDTHLVPTAVAYIQDNPLLLRYEGEIDREHSVR